MPDNNYRERLKGRDILTLVRNGIYSVDLDTGAVLNRHGRRLVPYVGNDEGHRFVRLYHRGKRKTIAVSRLVWMAGSRSTIPTGWEIHHKDMDPSNNTFDNLFCLHPKDHRKLHEMDLLSSREESDGPPIPF